MRSVPSRAVDRLLHTQALPPHARPPVRADVLDEHLASPVVDLVVGTPLFRSDVLGRRRSGHFDVPRALDGGLDLVGFTLATRFPDLRGTLSVPHFRSLGLPMRRLRTSIELLEALVARVDGWAARSNGGLRIVRTREDLDDATGSVGSAPPGKGRRLSAFLGVQGGHVIDGEPRNVGRLRDLGVRMWALAHVMDNDLVGSNTGRRRGPLTRLGREVVAEVERAGILVDLAHMSAAGIESTLPHLTKPFVLSHTGLTALSGRSGWRRFNPANRNVSDRIVREVVASGGIVGITFSTLLLGGETLDDVRRTFDHAIELAGPDAVAVGSDFDGALRMTFDVTGLPLLRQLLRDSGLRPDDASRVMGGNALRVLRAVFP